jgi:hypothetical protein
LQLGSEKPLRLRTRKLGNRLIRGDARKMLRQSA